MAVECDSTKRWYNLWWPFLNVGFFILLFTLYSPVKESQRKCTSISLQLQLFTCLVFGGSAATRECRLLFLEHGWGLEVMRYGRY